MSDDIIKRLREAIAAGPTPGEWVYLFGDRFVYTRLEDGCRGTPVVNADCLYGEAHFSTLQFVAACNPVAIRTLLDRLDAAEAENERLRCNAMQWRKPGPVTAEHPLDCLIVIHALRQADGDWWIEGSKFLADDAPIAWCADTSIARAALAQDGIKEQSDE